MPSPAVDQEGIQICDFGLRTSISDPDLLRRLRACVQPEQFHIEDQSRVGPDQIARAPLAVSQIRGDKQPPFGANRHLLQRFGPARDHVVQREGGGFAALVRAVEFGAVDQSAFVIGFNGVGGLGLLDLCLLSEPGIAEPLGRVLMPGLLLLAARKASPSFLFFSPNSTLLAHHVLLQRHERIAHFLLRSAAPFRRKGRRAIRPPPLPG